MCGIPKGFPIVKSRRDFPRDFNKIIIVLVGKSRWDSLKCGESLIKINNTIPRREIPKGFPEMW